MLVGKFLITAAAASMAIAPAMAASANPASSLSLAPVAKSVRAGTPAAKKNKLAGVGVVVLVLLGVGAAVGGIVAASTGSSTPASS